MPVLKQPLNLKTICLYNIALNMDSYWIKTNVELNRVLEMKRLPKYM